MIAGQISESCSSSTKATATAWRFGVVTMDMVRLEDFVCMNSSAAASLWFSIGPVRNRLHLRDAQVRSHERFATPCYRCMFSCCEMLGTISWHSQRRQWKFCANVSASHGPAHTIRELSAANLDDLRQAYARPFNTADNSQYCE